MIGPRFRRLYPPALPDDVVAKTRDRYREAMTRLMGDAG